MKFTLINNGIAQIVLVPETEIEKLSLLQFKDKTIEAMTCDKPTQVLDTPMPNALIFRANPKENSTKETELSLITDIETGKVVGALKAHASMPEILTAIETYGNYIRATFKNHVEERIINVEVTTANNAVSINQYQISTIIKY